MTDQADLIYERLLVVRAQAGDDAAFAELVERFSPRLRYFLRKLLPSAHDAEDALQDVWLDVLRLSPPSRSAGTRRLALSHRPRPGFCPPAQSGAARATADESTVTDTTTDDDHDFSAEDAEQIHAALDKLPPSNARSSCCDFWKT